MRESAKSRLVKLDVAAQRVGCHVETLRLRIRSGRLKAYRGPHGAYYIRVESLGGLLSRRSQPPPDPTPRDLNRAWRIGTMGLRAELVGRPLSDEGVDESDDELLIAIRVGDEQSAAFGIVAAFLRALVTDPAVSPGVYHLLCARGLAELGFLPKQVAYLLRLSDRQARRLVRRRDVARSFLRVANGWAQRRAHRLVAELRRQLEAEGVHFHRRVAWAPGPPVHPDRPRPAFRVTDLTPEDKLVLGRAGLTPEQIWAIALVGIGSDELNQLLLRGSV